MKSSRKTSLLGTRAVISPINAWYDGDEVCVGSNKLFVNVHLTSLTTYRVLVDSINEINISGSNTDIVVSHLRESGYDVIGKNNVLVVKLLVPTGIILVILDISIPKNIKLTLAIYDTDSTLIDYCTSMRMYDDKLLVCSKYTLYSKLHVFQLAVEDSSAKLIHEQPLPPRNITAKDVLFYKGRLAYLVGTGDVYSGNDYIDCN